ncbi:MAG TPA: hypothetical protein VEA80_03850 [Vitreimonas sp.]|uniref:hypothetical protein n=1 Tax=Vitreimonas sp. TaxID=3069702 RepID=UPI002D227B42|nr:hypothetical protein [Vitreimonas sp.]HYD86583.1 hypothetical protein [Vitreimonas sp.]
MTANAVDFGSAALSAFLRAAGLAVLAVGAALALFFAFAAAVIVGLMVTGAAVAMRFWPRRREARRGGPDVLEARSTPAGWVVETAAKRQA